MKQKMYAGLHVQYILFLADFGENLNFLARFSRNTYISNFMKIGTLGAELFHVDGRMEAWTERQTGLTKPTVAFRNFAKGHNKSNIFGISELCNSRY